MDTRPKLLIVIAGPITEEVLEEVREVFDVWSKDGAQRDAIHGLQHGEDEHGKH